MQNQNLRKLKRRKKQIKRKRVAANLCLNLRSTPSRNEHLPTILQPRYSQNNRHPSSRLSRIRRLHHKKMNTRTILMSQLLRTSLIKLKEKKRSKVLMKLKISTKALKSRILKTIISDHFIALIYI